MNKRIAAIRREYCISELSKTTVDDDPLVQFRKWLDDALNAQVMDPTAMTLATSGAEGRPSARIVLLKDVNDEGLSFFTNYESKKARQLEENPRAALLFYWPELERQVRFEGLIEKVAAGESDEYFASRPEGSKIGAWASRQSRMIASRSRLEDQLAEMVNKFKNRPVPRPEYWGGYRLMPYLAEFWQGRQSRLHDRIQYLLNNAKWHISRLSP